MHAVSFWTKEEHQVIVDLGNTLHRPDPYYQGESYLPYKMYLLMVRRPGRDWVIYEIALSGPRRSDDFNVTENFRAVADLPAEYRAIAEQYLPKEVPPHIAEA